MMKSLLILSLMTLSLKVFPREDSHAHSENKKHEEHEKENPQVGEGKGIVAVSDRNGIKLSVEAIKNFELETLKVENEKQIRIPRAAVVKAGDEVNLFRLRNGFFKRIDFHLVAKENTNITITSKELTSGDEIVIKGIGFLRIAEIAAFGGAPAGHSH